MQLLPPGNETAPGRMDCIITAPVTSNEGLHILCQKMEINCNKSQILF